MSPNILVGGHDKECPPNVVGLPHVSGFRPKSVYNSKKIKRFFSMLNS